MSENKSTPIETTAPTEKKKKPAPSRYFDCIMYDDPSNLEIDTILREAFRSIAYIYHDHDVKEDGSPKPPHYHLLGVTAEKHSAKTVAYQLAHLPQNIMVEIAFNRQGSWDYLTHKNAPTKYQYSNNDIYAEPEVLQRFRGLKGDNREFVEDMETMSMRDLAYTYGRDVMRNYRAYREYILQMHEEETGWATKCYTDNPAERAAMNDGRKYLVYKIDGFKRKTYMTANDISVKGAITAALEIGGLTEFDRILVTKRASDRFVEYKDVFVVAYTEAEAYFYG